MIQTPIIKYKHWCNLNDKEDVLQTISNNLKVKNMEKRNYGEVFTPMNFINENMLKNLENHYLSQYNNNIWENPTLTFFDPAAGMGNFSIAIYYKLMSGLHFVISDEYDRQKHIIERMLYMAELNENNCSVIKKIFNENNDFSLNLYEGDSLTLNIEKQFNIHHFDIIIGNPPYNDSFTAAGASPLYHKFIYSFINKCDILSFIIPSRWFSGGKGLDQFRHDMLNRNDLVSIFHFTNACSIFGKDVEIKGGVNYFLIDRHYNSFTLFNNIPIQLNKYDILIEEPKYYSIIDKVICYNTKLTSIYNGRCFGIETNDKRLLQLQNNDNHINNYLKCFVSQMKKKTLPSLASDFYIDKKELNGKEFDYWKIITTEAAHKHRSGFGNIFIGRPNEIHTGSFISFKVNAEEEAKSLISYLRCKLSNFLLSIRKNSQHINENVCSWIPLPPLDRIWNDADLCIFFKLSDEETLVLKHAVISNFKE